MALKKPSDFFREDNKSDDTIHELVKRPELQSFSEAFDVYKNNLSKLDNLADTINCVEDIKSEIQDFIKKEDLDNSMMAYTFLLEESINKLKDDVKSINKKDLLQIQGDVSGLTEQINEFVEIEVPKYKSVVVESELRSSNHLKEFKEKISNIIEGIEDSVEDFKKESVSQLKKETLSTLDEKINLVVENKNKDLEEEIKTLKTESIAEYREFIVDNKLKSENNLNEFKETLDETISNIEIQIKGVETEIDGVRDNKDSLFKNLQKKIKEVKNLKNNIIEDLETSENHKISVNKKVSGLEAEIIRNESHLKENNKRIEEHNNNIKSIQGEVHSTLKRLNLDELERQNSKLTDKIKYLEEVFEKFSEKDILSEGILNITPETNNSDTLTPLNKNFVTLDQLQEHYRVFINRIQQQLSTLGGGGETQLKYLDDVVGIATNPAAYDGGYLRYVHSLKKFAFSSPSDGDTWIQGVDGPYTMGRVGIGTSIIQSGAYPDNALLVQGDARITGILTIGTASITLNAETGSISSGEVEVVSAGGGANFTGIITAAGANFDGNVTIGGTLTYEDVKNVDSIGIITAKKDVRVGRNFNVTGISTFGSDKVIVGSGVTDLVVNGDARVTGILTIGTSSLTLDGSNNIINVGSATTIETTGYRIGNSFVHSTGISAADVTFENIVGTALSVSGIGTIGQIADSNGNVGTAASVLSSTGSGLEWVAQSGGGGGGGISLTDLSVTSNSAGTAALSYNNSSGVFTYTPPDLSGKQDVLTFGIADTNAVQIDDSGAANGEYAQLTTSGVAGITTETLKSNLSLNNVENTALSTWGGSSNITTVGTLGSLSVTGDVSIGGTLTYEDVTNIDSVGLITARSGIRIGATGDNTLITGKSTGIGIGTAVPTDFVDIMQGSDDHNIVVIRGADDISEYAGVGIQEGNAIFTGGGVGVTTTGIVFRTAAGGVETERVRITGIGSVGIGTTNPDVKLHISDSTHEIRLGHIESGTTSTDAGVIFTDVGIGTTGKFGGVFTEVNGKILSYGINISQLESTTGIDTYRTGGIFRLDTRDSGSFGDANCFVVKGRSIGTTVEHDSVVINLHDGNTILVPDKGDVGIGINNPDGKLHISSGTSGDCVMILEADTDNNQEQDNPYILFRQDGGIDESVIGMNPFGTSAENNALVLANSVANNNGIIFKTGTTNGYTNATERLRIKSDGNIGIGGTVLIGGHTQGTNDSSKLSVYDSGSNIGIIQVHCGTEDVGDLAGITFGQGGSNTTARPKTAIAAVGSGSYGRSDLCFYVDGTADNNPVSTADEKLRIKSDGDVGIGTDNPTGTAALTGNTKVLAVGVVTANTLYGSAANLTGLTGASADTYGSATKSPQITVDANGKITGISEATISGGSGEANQNAFSNVAVSGQTTVEAESATDTLTLVAGTNVTITTDASADSVTINASGGGGGGASGLWESNATGINTSTNIGIGTTTASDATLVVDVGTASTAVVVQGSEGQLFSVTNSLSSGSIFSVNDISGIPSIDVDADGTIQLAPYSTTENIGVGITNPTSKLHVVGTVKATDFDATSDIRLKTNIQLIGDPLAKVIQIEGVSFNWKENNIPALGVIADQIEDILPELVRGDDPKTVNYNGLIGLLIEAVKEQQTQIDSLKERISKLE